MNRTLLIIFLALLGIYGISKLAGGRKTRSFKAELVRVDTTDVDRIVIQAPGEPEFTLTLQDGGKWYVTNGKVSAPALRSVVTPLLATLTEIRAQRVAAKSPERWKDYQVDSTQGTRIRVYDGNRLLEDLVVGKFNFDPQLQSATAYVRLGEAPEVYAVDGFVAMNLAQDFDSFRKKTITKLDRNALTRIACQGEPAWELRRDSTRWLLDGEPADSTAVARYLSSITTVSGHEFADDFDPNVAGTPEKVLRITRKDSQPEVVIECWRDTTREKPFVIHSSLNPDAFFTSDSSGVFKRLFLPEWVTSEEGSVPN